MTEPEESENMRKLKEIVASRSTDLKTLKDIEGGILWHHSMQKQIIFMGNPTPEMVQKYNDKNFILTDDLRAEAIKWMKATQNGKFPILRALPESMVGSVAHELWDDERFAFGMDYGLLFAFFNFFGISEEDLK